MKIYSHIVNGHLSDGAELQFLAELSHHEGKDICITVERKRKKRSLNQNAYYWKVVIPIVRAMLEDYGNELDDEETHSFLKEHVGKLTGSVVDSVGRRVAVVKSTASLTPAEFEAYILKVTAWAAQEGCIIPSPNENLEPPAEAY
jgi:hypothetical protein